MEEIGGGQREDTEVEYCKKCKYEKLKRYRRRPEGGYGGQTFPGETQGEALHRKRVDITMDREPM